MKRKKCVLLNNNKLSNIYCNVYKLNCILHLIQWTQYFELLISSAFESKKARREQGSWSEKESKILKYVIARKTIKWNCTGKTNCDPNKNAPNVISTKGTFQFLSHHALYHIQMTAATPKQLITTQTYYSIHTHTNPDTQIQPNTEITAVKIREKN